MTHPILVFGSGPCAQALARRLASEGLNLLIAAPASPTPRPADAAAVESIDPARLAACSGFAGQFDVTLVHSTQRIQRRVAQIVIATDSRRRPHFDLYRLQAGSAVRSLSDFRGDLARRPEGFAGRRVVFLHGLGQESDPVVAGEVFRCALDLQAVSGARGHVLTGNLKVAGDGLEALYRDAKAAGTLFFKFGDTRPTIVQTANGRVAIDFQDEVTGHAYRLSPHITVVDESIVPAPELRHLAAVLGVHRGPAGFLQTENVHRLPVFTNRRGILAVGPARAAVALSEADQEAACGALAVRGLMQSDHGAQAEAAEIDPGQCIRCLTCLRLCPHGAVNKGNRVAIMADACAGCGICVAECPRGAIRLTALENTLAAEAAARTPAASAHATIFCCARSADPARALAGEIDKDLAVDATVVRVPCAGAVAVGHILAAFAGGAAGVLVLSCHTDNCYSETGNRHARRRVENLAERLERMGVGGGRLATATLAANMPVEYAEITRRFIQKIHHLQTQR